MVCGLKCDCDDRIGVKVSSIELFKKLKSYFNTQIEIGIFEEIHDKEPYYIWSDGNHEFKYIATKWYKCNSCGCLWEFNYPDFPANGFVRKFPNGIYSGTERIVFSDADVFERL